MAAKMTLAARYHAAPASTNCHHGMVSRLWYRLNDDQKLSPRRVTLKLPSRLSRRCWLSRDTTEPKPRSRRSCSLKGWARETMCVRCRRRSGVAEDVGRGTNEARLGSCIRAWLQPWRTGTGKIWALAPDQEHLHQGLKPGFFVDELRHG